MTHNQTTANKAAKARVELSTTRTLSLEHSAGLMRRHERQSLAFYSNRVMAADRGWSHFLWAGTLIMFLQIKFKFSKKFRTLYDFTQNFSFFELDCYAFPVKVCILNQLQLQRSPLKVYLKYSNAYRLARFLMLQFFIFQCFKPVTSCVVQDWDPPTTAIHLQSPTLESSSA